MSGANFPMHSSLQSSDKLYLTQPTLPLSTRCLQLALARRETLHDLCSNDAALQNRRSDSYRTTAAGLSRPIVSMAVWTIALYLAFLIAAEASKVQQLRSSVDRLKQLVTAEQVRLCHIILDKEIA